MVSLGFVIFDAVMIVLQIAVGSALVSWSPDKPFAEREESPRLFWLSIGFQVALVALFAVLLLGRR